MTWPMIFMTAFAFGTLMSVVSLLSGWFDFASDADVLDGSDADFADGDGGSLLSLNLTSLSAFAAAFGGTGYIVHAILGQPVVVASGVAALIGLAAAVTINAFIQKVLIGRGRTLRHEPIAGMIGTLSAAIREQGVGEVVFSSNGVRHSIPARSERETDALPVGAEVMIVRWDDEGIARVRPLEEIFEQSSA